MTAVARALTAIAAAYFVACATTGRTESVAAGDECARLEWGPSGPRSPSRWLSVPSRRDLSVFVIGSEIPVAGTTTDAGSRRIFRPEFPFAPGVRYRVVADGRPACVAIAPGQGQAAPARVAQIYPTAARLPENILRFYIYFSVPMAEGSFLSHIRLIHVGSGRDLTGVFFDNIHELWSSDRKRITLLVDPGRVKTGLRAHAKLGRAFRAGETYELQVLPSWRTLDNRPLEAAFSKVFEAGPEDRIAVTPTAWRITPPSPGSREPLAIDFGEPVDHVSVSHFIHVAGSNGTALRGRWQLGPDERTARWRPRTAWPDAISELALVVYGRFEDIAGNNVNAPFDHPKGAIQGPEDRSFRRPLTSPTSAP